MTAVDAWPEGWSVREPAPVPDETELRRVARSLMRWQHEQIKASVGDIRPSRR